MKIILSLVAVVAIIAATTFYQLVTVNHWDLTDVSDAYKRHHYAKICSESKPYIEATQREYDAIKHRVSPFVRMVFVPSIAIEPVDKRGCATSRDRGITYDAFGRLRDED